jgi:hypothetical protein
MPRERVAPEAEVHEPPDFGSIEEHGDELHPAFASPAG